MTMGRMEAVKVSTNARATEVVQGPDYTYAPGVVELDEREAWRSRRLLDINHADAAELQTGRTKVERW